jgi:hypothetical protein
MTDRHTINRQAYNKQTGNRQAHMKQTGISSWMHYIHTNSLLLQSIYNGQYSLEELDHYSVVLFTQIKEAEG